MTRLFVIITFCLLTLPIMAEPADCVHNTLQRRLDSLLCDEMLERTQLGLYVYDLTADTTIYKAGHRQRMRPASCEKILTAATALYYLGTDYDFKTEMYLDEHSQLYLRGGMDPLLTKQDLATLVGTLRKNGVKRIHQNIICDASFKDTTGLGWGWCWDDPYTPLKPFLLKGKGSFQQAFQAELQAAHIDFTGKFQEGRVPLGLEPFSTIKHGITEVLQPMMKKSDNLCAESVFYQLCRLFPKDYPTSSDAIRMVEQYIDRLDLVISDYKIADGSGLSLYNYVTPELLVRALKLIHEDPHLYDTLLKSLPVMGRDGTLRKRCCGTSAENQVFAKTGTVTGVSSLSGYAIAPNGHVLAFSIINQGIRKTSEGHKFQDSVCQALTRPL